MCIWPFVGYIHAVSTSGAHPNKRKNHKYSKRCSQCFKVVDENTHVAAHVVAYPCFCFNCCLGVLTLKTTCKKCNSKNKTGKKRVDKHGWFFIKTIFTSEYKLGTKLKCIVYPYCFHYDYKD